jgi:hypothetical protein
MRSFELSAIGGPWGRRLARHRRWLDSIAWPAPCALDDDTLDGLRALWTRTAFSEYASAAAFAEIATALLEAGAPIDLIAAAGDFVVDEIVHAEASARVANWLGGAVDLAVDLERLVRPPSSGEPLLRAATLIVRTSCVGEALTVPILKLARKLAGDPTVREVLGRIVADESGHAQLGWWFLDWAGPHLTDDARARLGREAGIALRAFAPALGCDSTAIEGYGAIACRDYDPAFAAAARRHVAQPLAQRGIEIPREDLEAVHAVS